MKNKSVNTDRISQAEAVKAARRLSLRCGTMGAIGPAVIADALMATIAAESGMVVALASANMIGNTIEDVALAINDLKDRINDADTCYRDSGLANDGFDSLPEWSRDMIVNSHQDQP